ncbi:uncharacterized protein ISCGN_021222 [Ixodes scapularis]
MSIVCPMLPFFLTQVVFVRGQENSNFPTGIEEPAIEEKDLQFNLEDVAVEFLYNYAKKRGDTLWDFDITGDSKKRPTNPNRPPVTAKMSELTFLQAETVSTKPMVAYTQLFHNGQPDRNNTATISREFKHQNTYTYTVERGIDTGLKGEWSAGVPEMFGLRTEMSIKFSTLWGSSETKTTETTYSLNQIVYIPPESTVRVQWLIAEEVMDVPWDALMYLTGYFGGYFKRGDNWLWVFFPVGVLEHPYVEKQSEDSILFRAKGRFSGVKAKNNYVVTRERRHYQ